MNPNYGRGFGGFSDSTPNFTGLPPTGRGRAIYSGGFQHRNVQPNQFRGGNRGRPFRGNFTQGGGNYQQNFRPTFLSRYDNPVGNDSNRVLNETKSDQLVSNEPAEEVSQDDPYSGYEEHSYEYDEEEDSGEANQDPFEQIPEYRQSRQMEGYEVQIVDNMEESEYNKSETTCDSNQINLGESQEVEQAEFKFCNFCNKTFQTIGAYGVHMEKHRGSRSTSQTSSIPPRSEGSPGFKAQLYNQPRLLKSQSDKCGSGNYQSSEYSNQSSQGKGQPGQWGPQDSHGGQESSELSDQPSQGPSQEPAATQSDARLPEAQKKAESSDSEDDTSFCKYCQLSFTTPKAFHTHTRGLQHTTLVMEAKAAKGDKRFEKEVVPKEVLEVVIPKPQEPVVVEKMTFDVEDNWMGLEEDVLSYIKEKKNLEDKDLHPEELGKKVGDDFSCPLCEIFCTGPMAFKSHLEGKSHRMKMQQAEQGVLIRKKKALFPKVAVPSSGRPSKLSRLIEDVKSPMLGLEYITEFQKPNLRELANYVCNLCEAKMNESCIVSHIVGVKHRMRYLKVVNFTLYEHLQTYATKKKKSELNANCEEFAEQIEKEKGRAEVKVKIEVVDEMTDPDLDNSMRKVSRELRDKVKELEEKHSQDEPPVKRGKFSRSQSAQREEERKPVGRSWNTQREDHWAHQRDRGHERDWDRERDWNRDRDTEWNWDYIRLREQGRGYDRGWDLDRDWERGRERFWDRDRYAEGERHRFYHYRWAEYDSMDDRRLVDERRYLDTQLLARYRLDDPLAERRRMDDIIARQHYIEDIEKARLERVMAARRQMEETDPDILRLRRFQDRFGGEVANQGAESVRESTAPVPESAISDDPNYRPSLEELKAHRRQHNRDLTDRLEERPVVSVNHQTDQQAGETTVALPAGEGSLASRVLATKSVQEEVARNPGVDVSDLLAKLSSSMIASEDEAAMALQISSALTQALLTYRLQKTQATEQNPVQATPEQPPELSIPGLGTTSSAETSQVPSFLKTPYTTASFSQQTGPQVSYVPPNIYTTQQNGAQVAQPGLPVSNMFQATQTWPQVSDAFQQHSFLNEQEHYPHFSAPDFSTSSGVSSVQPSPSTSLSLTSALANFQTAPQVSYAIPHTYTGYEQTTYAVSLAQSSQFGSENVYQAGLSVSSVSQATQNGSQYSGISQEPQSGLQYPIQAPQTSYQYPSTIQTTLSGLQVPITYQAVGTGSQALSMDQAPETKTLVSHEVKTSQTGASVTSVSNKHTLVTSVPHTGSPAQKVSESVALSSSYSPYTSTPSQVCQSAPPVTDDKSYSPRPLSLPQGMSTSIGSLVKNSDQPQKDILESIRKQTELLKKKIQLATSGAAAKSAAGSPGSSAAAAASQPKAAGFQTVHRDNHALPPASTSQASRSNPPRPHHPNHSYR